MSEVSMVRVWRRACAAVIAVLAVTLPPGSAHAGDEPALERLKALDRADRDLRLPAPDGIERRQWVQLVWNDRLARLERKVFAFFDPFAGSGYELSWVPDGDGGAEAGPITGHGTMIWRQPGSSLLDASAIVARYQGDLARGYAAGRGIFRHRSGLSYRGAWDRGLPDGEGRLRWPNGDDYVGSFDNGLPDGPGIYVDASGAIYDGGHLAGRREGTGTLYLPDGTAFAALWADDRPVGGTKRFLDEAERRFPLVLATDFDQARDIRINVLIDRAWMRRDNDWEIEALEYEGRSEGETLKIALVDEQLRGVWRGQGNIAVDTSDQENLVAEMVGFYRTAERVVPIPLVVEVENRGGRRVQITEAFIAMESSSQDLDPVIHVISPGYMLNYDEDAGTVAIVLIVQNFGWGTLDSAEISFGVPGTQSDETVQLDDLGPEPRRVEVNPLLARLGVDLEALVDDERWDCTDEQETCLNAIMRDGVFGDMADSVYLAEGGAVLAPLEGSISMSWVDAEGEQRSRTSDFSTILQLAQFAGMAEMGDGGMRDAGRNRPFTMRVDGEDYEIALPIQDTVNAGVRASWRVSLEGPASSDHRFRFAFVLSDGRTIASRPIELEYFKPRTLSDEDESLMLVFQ